MAQWMKTYSPKRKKGRARLAAVLLGLSLLAGCGSQTGVAVSADGSSSAQGTVAAVAADSATGADGTETSGDSLSTGTETAIALALNGAGDGAVVTYETEDTDASWEEASATLITYSGTSASVAGDGAVASGSTVTIALPGTYVLSGASDNGQVVVNAEIKGAVRLVLNGLTLSNADTAPIEVLKGSKTVLILADGTDNVIRDGVTGQTVAASEEEMADPNAAIWSKGDLTITGNGSLTVEANRNHGIYSKDTLKIVSGDINVTAVADGIKARDYVAMADGSVSITAGSDGLQASNDEDATMGFVSIEGGVLTIQAGLDGIQAETDVLLLGGDISIATGEGSGSLNMASSGFARPGATTQTTSDESLKGVKAADSILVDGASLTIDAEDDAVHAGNLIDIRSGTLTLSSADDGLHADAAILIEDGTIDILKSYEGIESLNITVNGGNISMVTSDDGFNVAGGADGSGGAFGRGGDTATAGAMLTLNGGTILVNAEGDGLDSNGSMIMTGGDVTVFGPTNNGNGAIDYNGTFSQTGGTLLAVGSTGMAQAPDTSSTQPAILVNLTQSQAAGTVLSITNASGEVLVAVAPTKTYQSVVFSSPELAVGDVLNVQTGGTASAAAEEGVYPEGVTITGGTVQATVTLENIVTTSGAVSGMGGGFGGMGGGGRTRPGGGGRTMPASPPDAQTVQ